MDEKLNSSKMREDEYEIAVALMKEKIHEERRQKEFLRSQLETKDALIQQLSREIARRDRILEFSTGDKAEVTLHIDPEGRRTFEMMSKEQIPFWIKTEQLNPTDWSYDKNIHPSEELPLESPGASISYTKNRSNSSYLEKVESEEEESEFEMQEPQPGKRRFSSSSHFQPEYKRLKREKSLSPACSVSSISSSESGFENSQESTGESVLDIPELHRINFGCSELFQLNKCPHALKFWYDEENSHRRKFFIRFHDDPDFWNGSRELVVKIQSDLSLPKMYRMTLGELISTLTEDSPRIWLDTRDFDGLLSSQSSQRFFSSFGPSITHFSFGRRLDTGIQVKETWLLTFILENLPNLRFLSINDEMLDKNQPGLNSSVSPGNRAKLRSLKTLRLINSTTSFSTGFIFRILKKAPNLQNFYGVPLHAIHKLDKNLDKKFPSSIFIRSVFIMRSIYTDPGKFYDDLTYLKCLDGCKKRGNFCPALEELDTRTFFVFDPIFRSRCIQRMSQLIQDNKNTLTKLSLERLTSSNRQNLRFLDIPTMEKVTTLHFDFGREKTSGHWSFFPRGFCCLEKFPNLFNIEIHVDSKSRKKSSPQLPYQILKENFPSSMFRIQDDTADFFSPLKSLSLHLLTSPEVIGRIASTFQDLKIIRLHNHLPEIVNTLPQIFKYFNQLQELILEIDTDNSGGNLDSAVTGIPEVHCKILEKKPLLPFEKVELEVRDYRDDFSICNLPNLKIFKIVLRSSSDTRMDKTPIFTPSAAIYGFGKNLMPSLKVQVTFDERTSLTARKNIISSLASVRPYIELEE